MIGVVLSLLVLTHVQSYSDNVERHGGVSDTAERYRLRQTDTDRHRRTERTETKR